MKHLRSLSCGAIKENTEMEGNVTNAVIASAAKQSSPTKQDWIASSQVLLAMTW
jgi:hypothetical protein